LFFELPYYYFSLERKTSIFFAFSTEARISHWRLFFILFRILLISYISDLFFCFSTLVDKLPIPRDAIRQS
jgi:hypothetical protein